MNTLVKTYLLLALLFGVLGCDSAADQPIEQPATLVVETDRSLYSPRDTVTVSFVNGRASTVYVMSAGCGSLDRKKPLPVIWFEQFEGGEWSPYARGITCPAVLQAPAELAPEDAYDVRFRVGLGPLPDLPPGTYRYVFYVAEEPYANETVLPEEERTSTPFEVRE